MIRNIRDQLARDEGRKRSFYFDSLGYATIGIGRLIDARRNGGLSEAEIDFLFANDLAAKSAELDAALPWWRELDEVRGAVLQNMAFQMGTAGLLKFQNTLALIHAHQWEKAAQAMRNSLWYRQTPERAERLCQQIISGEWK